MKPYSELPWTEDGYQIYDASGTATFSAEQYYPWVETADFSYIVHAANSYPKLVALVKDYSEEYGHGAFLNLLKELGELE